MFDLCVIPKSEVISTTPSFPMYGVYSELYMSNIKTVEYEENLTYSIDKICNLNEVGSGVRSITNIVFNVVSL